MASRWSQARAYLLERTRATLDLPEPSADVPPVTDPAAWRRASQRKECDRAVHKVRQHLVVRDAEPAEREQQEQEAQSAAREAAEQHCLVADACETRPAGPAEELAVSNRPGEQAGVCAHGLIGGPGQLRATGSCFVASCV
jgi:hypothetical protein